MELRKTTGSVGGEAGVATGAGDVLAAGRGSRAGQEKKNMTEFIAKKREMFLVQMSLDTKREEIRKLEEKAAMKVKGEGRQAWTRRRLTPLSHRRKRP
jgi:uncharacterized protein YbjQ (UPF0145 family)